MTAMPVQEGRRPAPAVPGVSVIVPVFNEAEGIGGLLDELLRTLRALDRPFEVIVVDDGSTDGSGDAARMRGVEVVGHGVNRGYGAALKTGIRRSQHPLVAIIDGDGTYPIDTIPALLGHLETCDMAVGARTGPSVAIPLARRPAKWVLTRLANYLSGHRIPDLNSGLRIFRRDMAERFFGLFPEGFSFTTTITMAALTNGYRVTFVPVNYYKRAGQSSIRPVRDFLGFLLLIIRLIVYFKPLNVFLPASSALLVVGLTKAALDYSRTGAFGVGSAIAILVAIQIAFLGLLADLIMRRTQL
ncbi:MAG: glycosyltransferase family 2 protein [Vicinamibacterales bacterium]